LVIGCDEHGADVGYATVQEIEAAMHRPEPQSVTEAQMRTPKRQQRTGQQSV
jgi:hypothetical protein